MWRRPADAQYYAAEVAGGGCEETGEQTYTFVPRLARIAAVRLTSQ